MPVVDEAGNVIGRAVRLSKREWEAKVRDANARFGHLLKQPSPSPCELGCDRACVLGAPRIHGLTQEQAEAWARRYP
jgi:hypothetical protein